MTPLAVAATVLAVYRLVRLVTVDRVAARPRDWLIWRSYRHSGDRVYGGSDDRAIDWTFVARDDDLAPAVAYLVVCPWCVSVYVAVPVVAACYWAPSVWTPVAYVLALSAVAGLGRLVEDRLG